MTLIDQLVAAVWLDGLRDVGFCICRILGIRRKQLTTLEPEIFRVQMRVDGDTLW